MEQVIFNTSLIASFIAGMVALFAPCCITFLLPSYFEGLPNALLEAMSFGLVPICTNVGSIPNVITNNIDGYLIPMRNSNVISEKIQYLNNDRVNLKNVATNAHKSIYVNYSIESYIYKLNRIYDSI